VELGGLSGVYSDPRRDRRVHGVTVVVFVTVTEPSAPPTNPAEISDARLFSDAELPAELSHGMTDMLDNARSGRLVWE
jgi:ADP-ribose pyrophosphatase YjhB (NUDIX family)